jgi:hypothetical protein
MKLLLGLTITLSFLALAAAARLFPSGTPCASKSDDAPCSEAG